MCYYNGLRVISIEQCPFDSIRFVQGKLRLNNWCGVYFIVDPISGMILEEVDNR